MADQTQIARLDILLNGEQAADELQNLRDHARELSKEIDKARQTGNHAFAKQLTKELKETENNMKRLKQETFELSKVLNNLSAAKPRELSQALSALQAKLNSGKIQRGSTEWDQLQNSIRRVRAEMQAVSAESAVAESRLSRLSNGFNKYFAIITTFLASVTGLSLAFRKLSEENAKMDDTYADVMKTTQMTKEEVVSLNEEFKKIDTRTARENLNKIAEEGGRIGIAKDEILEFTEAMNVANVALGDSFKGGVEEIANTLGKLKFLFQETKEMGVEKAYLSIGSAINDLGANGVASEANIANFATRVGSLPEALKPSLASTLALGAAFEESGIEAEISSRAYNIFLKQASTNADKFAKVMRISTTEVENLINTDPLEFFLKFAEGMQGMDATDVAKTLSYLGVNADGANKALGAAANNTERFRELIELSNKSFKEGTSVVNEYNIKNNTLAARLDKSRKEFKEVSLELGSKLNPILLKSTSGTTYLVRSLVDLIKWVNENKKMVGSLVITWVVYILWVNGAAIITKSLAFWNGTLTTSFKTLGKAIKANPWGLIVSGAILAISWLNKYLNKQKEVNKEQEEFITLAEQTKDLFAENKSLDDRVKVMKALSKNQLKTLKSELDNQIKALEDHDAKILTLTKKTLDEDQKLNDLKRKQSQAATELERMNLMTEIRWRTNELVKDLAQQYNLNSDSLKNLRKHKEEVEKLLGETPDDDPYNIPGDEDKENKALKAALKKEEDRYNQAKADLKKRYSERLEDEESFNKKLEEIESEHLQKEKDITEQHGESSAEVQDKIYDRMIKRVEDEKALLDKLSDMYDQFDLKAADRDKVELIKIGQKFDAAKRLLDDGLSKQILSQEQYDDLVQQLTEKRLAAEEKAIQDNSTRLAAEEMKRLDTVKALEESAFAEQHRNGLLTEGAYREALLNLDRKYLNEKLNLTGLSPEQKNEINKGLSLNQADTDDFKKKERESARDRNNLSDLKALKEEEYKIIDDFEARGVLSHEEAAQARAQIDQEYLETLTGKLSEENAKIQGITANLTASMSGFQQSEEMAVSRKYDKMIKAAEGNSKKQAKLEEKKEKELNAIRAKYADKQFVVKIASIAASTAVAAMEAYSAMSGIAVVGPALGAVAAAAVVAAGAAQIAVAKQERDNAKEGYAAGGYTPSGPWDKQQGVVHSDEFIGNRFATRNPAVRKVFNVVDEAQKNNTVSSLSEKDFAKALNYREAENRSTVAGIAGVLASRPDDDKTVEIYTLLLAWIRRNADTTERLNARLDEPFVGEVYIDGPRGVKKNLDDYDRLIQNASR
jgi:TP901 family phage tail tape measure protein